MDTKVVTVMLVGVFAMTAFTGCLDALLSMSDDDCGSSQLDPDPPLEQQERNNREGERIEEERRRVKEQQEQEEQQQEQQNGSEEQQQDQQEEPESQQDNGQDTGSGEESVGQPERQPGKAVPEDRDDPDPGLSEYGRKRIESCGEFDLPKDITFFSDQEKNRLEVVDVSVAQNWTDIYMYHGTCGSPHLNADGPAIAYGKPVGNESVVVGDYIQVYPEISGCVFNLLSSEGSPFGGGGFPGKDLDIVFSVDKERKRVEVSSINDNVRWDDITTTKNSCGELILARAGGEEIPRGNHFGEGPILAGDYIQLHSNSGCSFELKFWETNKPIGKWSV